jgi:hypothetical protein
MKFEFFIDRDGNLTANGDHIGNFGSEANAADFAIRHAQENDRLYVIHYARFVAA